jgi:hypothetical protein
MIKIFHTLISVPDEPEEIGGSVWPCAMISTTVIIRHGDSGEILANKKLLLLIFGDTEKKKQQKFSSSICTLNVPV